MPIVAGSRRARDFFFARLPYGRLRTYLVANYFHQVVRWQQEANVEKLLPQVHPEAEVRMWDLGIHHGRPGWAAALNEWHAAFQDASIEMHEFVDPGNAMVLCAGLQGGRGAGSGVMVERELAWVVTVAKGMAVGGRMYNTRAEALEGMGVSAVMSAGPG